MNGYCPDCGCQLSVVKRLDKYGLTALICPRCHDPGFLEVADARWIYPLQRLEYGTLGRIMTADEATLDLAASRIWAVRQEPEQLGPELALEIDRRAAQDILTDLTWATENCTAMGLHQIGQAMDDTMGVNRDGTEES